MKFGYPQINEFKRNETPEKSEPEVKEPAETVMTSSPSIQENDDSDGGSTASSLGSKRATKPKRKGKKRKNKPLPRGVFIRTGAPVNGPNGG